MARCAVVLALALGGALGTAEGALQVRLRGGGAEGSSALLHHGQGGPPVTVREAGDHSMILSDGQSWTGLATGVAIYPGYAGLWTPKEHQHHIRAEDIDMVAKPGVTTVVIGLGMSGDGRAELAEDAVERLKQLKEEGLHSFVGSTPKASKEFNKLAEAAGDDSVAGFFHTGC